MSVPVGALASKSRPITAVNWSRDSRTEKSSSPRKLAGNTSRPCVLITKGFTCHLRVGSWRRICCRTRNRPSMHLRRANRLSQRASSEIMTRTSPVPSLRLDRAGVAVAARVGAAVGRDGDRRELAGIIVRAPQQLQEHLGRLRAADRVLAVGDEERHAGDAVARGLLLVGSHRAGVAVPVEDGLYPHGRQAGLGGQTREGGLVGDWQAFGEGGPHQAFLHLRL